MVWWWWIIPATVGVLGVTVLVSGLASLVRGRLLGGLFSTLIGGGAATAAAAAVLLGLNVQTYARLTYERPVATVLIDQQGPQLFEATVIQPAAEEGGASITRTYPLHGDEWRIEAQVLRWRPWAQALGLDTQYRLDRLSGRYRSVERELNATRSVHALSGGDQADAPPWRLDAWDLARRYRRHVNAVDTLYGGAAYMPMADQARYEVWITQSGLVARPANAAARDASAGGWMMAD